MRKILIFLSLLCGLAYASTAALKATYVPDPNETRVENAHYDPELKMVVIHVHAKVLWFTIEEIYGLKVKDDSDIDAVWKRIIGDQPQIVHLKKTS